MARTCPPFRLPSPTLNTFSPSRKAAGLCRVAKSYHLRCHKFKNSKHREVSGIGRDQPVNARCVKDGGEISVENSFAAKTELPHPAQRLLHALRTLFDQTNCRVCKKGFRPIQRFSHCQRRTEAPVVCDHVEKFIDDQRRKDKTATLFYFGLDGGNSLRIRRMILQGELNECRNSMRMSPW